MAEAENLDGDAAGGAGEGGAEGEGQQQQAGAGEGGAAGDAVAQGAGEAGSGGGDPLAGEGEGDGSGGQPSFPDNWRDLMADGDDKLRKQLDNFTDPGKVAKAFADVRKKLGSGEYMRKLPEDATEEEVASWRKENGVPEAPDGYELKLPDGFELEDDDQAVASSFMEFAHKANLPNDSVNVAMNWYAAFQNQQREQMTDADLQHKEAAIQELRSAWPQGEYQRNLNAGREVLQSVGDDFADLLLSARMPDGMAVGNHPGFRQFLAQVAAERDPSTLLPGGVNNIEGIDSEIDQIRKFMRTNRDEYNRDEKMQKRFQELIEAKQRLAS